MRDGSANDGQGGWRGLLRHPLQERMDHSTGVPQAFADPLKVGSCDSGRSLPAPSQTTGAGGSGMRHDAGSRRSFFISRDATVF